MEQILAWNPQVIFVQDCYPQVINEINQQPVWQTVGAVKIIACICRNTQSPGIIRCRKRWRWGELAKKLFLQKFGDIDMQQQADSGISASPHTLSRQKTWRD
ncbi:hypothetical protein BBW68_03890 [Candidatus Erwinia dacicola]|uniref:Fe/B12 periplasmic-binding domain-containing protein n=1 Tax=Candidatus Erwinia dacicola TaxID=252393 RepID=A0A1E7Z579_9GAMM|nr:hypothetical protein BBW68_03890 [Candidatus Erwinia dacicola]